ncbi:MAG: PEP-CTERM sorting domain-containing protein [Akkermansiaceae bacterium]|nr:PEP-CTERM sorting domain-containing protein [Akkermansiaceae bacterium]
MKTTFITAALCLGLAASASADTTLDLLETVADTSTVQVAYTFGTSTDNIIISASTIAAWLDGQSDGLYWTFVNGSTSADNPVSPTLSSGESGYTLSFWNRKNYNGSVVGIATTIEDTSSLTSLDFSYTESVNEAGTIYLVYQTGGTWTMESTGFTVGNEATISIDLSETSLSSSTVYAVVVTTTGGGSKETGTISLTAASGAVPEPATATLGLLALGALALRRRRA